MPNKKHQPYVTVNDPDFGTMWYYDAEVPLQPKNIDSICMKPFKNVEIMPSGDVLVCCQLWLPATIGNVLQNTLKEIWVSDKANKLRGTILDGTYKYCNGATCHYLKGTDSSMVIPKHKFTGASINLPEHIMLSVDESCNLHCPSCRLNKKMIAGNNIINHTSYKVIAAVLDQVFDTPHDNHIRIGLDGLGDVFSSAIYRHIIDNRPYFSNLDLWPNVKFLFYTNGVMMTEKIQKKWYNLINKSKQFVISIDAGNKESYDKVRLGGDWDLLWKNLDYLYDTVLSQRSDVTWSWQVVLQRDNYKSFPELIERAYKYSDNLPFVCGAPIFNWSTFTQDEYNDRAVWLSTSPEYNQLHDMLESNNVVNYPRFVTHITSR